MNQENILVNSAQISTTKSQTEIESVVNEGSYLTENLEGYVSRINNILNRTRPPQPREENVPSEREGEPQDLLSRIRYRNEMNNAASNSIGSSLSELEEYI